MGRKKRRQPDSIPRSVREEAFHSPFTALQEQLRQVATSSTNGTSAAPPASVQRPASARPQAPPPPATPPPSASQNNTVARRDKVEFLAAMTGVTRFPRDARGYVEKRRQAPLRQAPISEDAAGLAALRDVVEGRGAFTIQYTDEYMEGVAPGVDRRLAQRLHRGDYAVHTYCDLHGHTVEEARVLVERFLTQAYTMQQRCVLVIHGRGLNSKDNRPVLKEHVQLWLSHGRLSRLVLAFATAPATDGGAGAVYVLLRRASQARRHGS